MVTLDNISFEFGGRWLYRNTTLQIKPGDHIGLIGRNGTGKSTLLRIITGEYSLTEGQVAMPKSLKIGFLNQDLLDFSTSDTAFQVARSAFADVIGLQKEIDALLNKMESDTSPELVIQLSEKQMQLEARDGYNIDQKTAALLAGLGFSEQEQQQPYDTFSGGWRMRIMLAKILLQDPDLLLLDEPTNHLDLPSIKWIENYLLSFPGAFVVVSHDRFFLDRVVKRTIEIDQYRFNEYKGNYSFFMKEKVLRREQHQREYENQQKFIYDTERFINRFRAKASKAKQVQSKVKMLEKLERIEAPDGDAAVMSLRFEANVVPGKVVAGLDVKDKSYGPKHILGQSTASVLRGDKIALIGANGLGKSTLLRMIAGTEPFEGELRPGHNVHQTMYAQHQLEALNVENSILEEMSYFSAQKGETYVRNILGCFLFSGDDVEKKIKVLSGGEKSRVALAKTLLSDANFLLLDEPTNHLDIQSIEILIEALRGYNGTFVVVSHDRYFLGEVANKIWYIEDREAKEYPGTYDEFEDHLARNSKSLSAPAQGTPTPSQPAKEEKSSGKKQTKAEYEAMKKAQRRRSKLSSDLEKTENSIMEMEEKRQKLIDQMADPAVSAEFEKLAELQSQVDAMDKELETLNGNWESIVEELESLPEAN